MRVSAKMATKGTVDDVMVSLLQFLLITFFSSDQLGQNPYENETISGMF